MDALQIFHHAEFGTVRVIERDDKVYFVGRDVAAALGYTNTKDALASHVDDEDKTLLKRSENATFEIPNRGLTIITEAGVYSLVFGSELPSAKMFKRWLAREVLPAIRKHGVYAVESLLDNPDALIQALTAYKQERDKSRELEQLAAIQKQQLAELRPKASYYDLVLQCRDLVTISVIAKDYGWSATQMNNWLHQHGIQYKQGNIWLLYQDYAPLGYTSTKTFSITDGNGTPHNRTHTYWTQKGRLFIYQLMTSEGNHPLIEQGR